MKRFMMFFFLFLLLVMAPSSMAQDLHPLERQALLQIKSELSDAEGGSFLSTWDFESGKDPCGSFSGLVCTVIGDSSHIVMLNLGSGYAGSPGLAGRLSPRIGDLMLLEQLTLVAGAVRGRLPKSIGRLKRLQFLGMSHNRISGCIPDSLGGLTNLQVLDLHSNFISCSIPKNLLQSMPNLVALQLSHNNLTGPIPNFSSSNKLSHVDLSWNSLSGALLPGYFPESVSFLALSNNILTGPIDPALRNLHRLTMLDLSFNALSGNIPSAIFTDNPDLETLLLQRNQFSGPMSLQTAPIRVTRVDLSFNNLSGNIPAMLAYAQNVYLNNNRFTGAVPREFADGLLSANLRNLYLQHNFLTGFSLDEPLPAAALLCLQYNCLTPPSQSACPLTAGKLSSRPAAQCTADAIASQG